MADGLSMLTAEKGQMGPEGDKEISRLLPKVRKCLLSEQELEAFKERLIHLRQRLVDDVGRLEMQAMHSESTSTETEATHAPPMPSSGDEAWEQLMALGAIDRKRTLIHEIDAALERIANDTYGICVVSHQAISKSLLEEIPWCATCANVP